MTSTWSWCEADEEKWRHRRRSQTMGTSVDDSICENEIILVIPSAYNTAHSHLNTRKQGCRVGRTREEGDTSELGSSCEKLCANIHLFHSSWESCSNHHSPPWFSSLPYEPLQTGNRNLNATIKAKFIKNNLEPCSCSHCQLHKYCEAHITVGCIWRGFKILRGHAHDHDHD